MNKLLSLFSGYIRQEKLFVHQQRLLVAVSGGLDSVVLCHLLRATGYDFEMAHVNFGLRGAESDRDAEFVQSLAARLGLKFHLTTVDTTAYAVNNKCSVQVAARELRYQWFEELLRVSAQSAEPLDLLLTAHHANDNAETVLLNLFRGTGLQGMLGILPLRNFIRRPLLFATREELLDYANAEKLSWVEDSSNASEKYARNFIRLSVIPLLQKQYPSLVDTLNNTSYHFRQVQAFYAHAMDSVLKKLIVHKGREQWVPIGRLRQLPGAEAVLFAWIYPLGFSTDQVKGCMALLDSQTGHYMVGSGCDKQAISYRLLKDRKWLVISPAEPGEQAVLVLEQDRGQIMMDAGALEWETIDYIGQSVSTDKNTALLDAANIVYPLLVRKWKAGDYFYPMGMRKKKKLARFFIDSKINRIEKEKVRILESDKKILWLVGHRIDDRFKVSNGTRRILVVKFLPAGN
mgnify:CR=1 FL=1